MNPTQQITSKSRRGARHTAPKRRDGIPLSASPARDLRTWRLRPWQAAVVCLVLATATVGLYSPVSSHPFINYDDPSYVTENPHVLAGLSWQTFSWALTANYSANWHPLTWLSHALDCEIYGLDAGGHHMTNVLLHAVNSVLIFLLLWRATRAPGRSIMVAALFALHPVNVGSVAWIAERKNLLSMFFFLLTLAAYGWYVRRKSWKRYAAVAFLFALGLASKPMVITLPLVLMLLDYWPLARIERWSVASAEWPVAQLPAYRLALEKAPLLLLAAASAVITVLAQRSGNAIAALGRIPLSWRLENVVYSYARYVGKVFWPVDFALEYPHPLGSLTAAQVGLPLAFLIAVSALLWRQRARRPYALVGWLWFLGTLVPVIGIVQVGAQGMADRYMYLPEIGIFIVAVWFAAELIGQVAWKLQLAAVAGLAILVVLAVLSFRQIGYWRSSLELWRHTLEVTQNNFVADDSMGELLLVNGDPGALAYFEAAARLAPYDPESHAALAGNLHDKGALQQAIEEYGHALRGRPEPKLRAHIYADLGVIYRQLDDRAKAREASRLALAVDASEVHTIIQQLSDRLAAQPSPTGYWLLGLYLEGAEQPLQARSAYRQALQLDPNFAPASRALAEQQP